MTTLLHSNIRRAINARRHLFVSPHNTAFRLFNGFTEGEKKYVIDVFGSSAVIHDYSDASDHTDSTAIAELVRDESGFVDTAILKVRQARTASARDGVILFGDNPAGRIVENGVRYALDITMNQDASFYIDTRNLRHWATEHLKGKRVLNTFAYTGSIGIAAQAAGAQVVQTDLNRTFLNLAKQSCAMNGLPVARRDFIAGDFFVVMKQLARQPKRFDCVILDPPFFSKTSRGTVDLLQNMGRLINKVRPLVSDGGTIIAVNNAIYLSGQEYIQNMEALCDDGYVTVDSTIDVPADCTGYPDTVRNTPIIDPSPFNHATKIAILSIRCKN